MIAGLVLAAALSRRMGRPKLLLELGGKAVVRWAVEAVLPHVGDLIVVTGHEEAGVRAALGGLFVRFAVNLRPEDGQGTSIAIGASALVPGTRAALVVLGDQPRLPAEIIAVLLREREGSGEAGVAPVVARARCTPVPVGARGVPDRVGLERGAD